MVQSRAMVRAMKIIDITEAAAAALRDAERVHRQLRPHMPADYAGTMKRVFEGGARMAVAEQDGRIAGVAVYRMYVNTFAGLHMYVDDLVTDETARSTGVGHALMEHLQAIARAAGCKAFTLDSGTQREQAHKFYFREGMTVKAFHFVKSVGA
jgi:GNAT superfamily N-acetyltransferase